MNEVKTEHRSSRELLADSAAVVLAALVGLTLSASLVRAQLNAGPLALSARMAWGWPGETTLRIPPFGTATGRTHIGPARLVVTVESVDLAGVERLLAETPAARAVKSPAGGVLPEIRSVAQSTSATVSDVFAEEGRRAAEDFAGLALGSAITAAAAAAVVAVALRRRVRIIGASAFLAFSLVGGGSAVAAASFDMDAMAEPRLEGALASVPRLATVFSARVTSIERLRDQAAETARKLAAYYANPRSIAAGGGLPGTYRVLHVGDLHMDPVGAELSRSLVRSYEASLVIDTGDVAISGTRAEAGLLPSLVVTSVPVVYVPGNHDSPHTLRVISRLPNFTVATSSVTIEGLEILPVPDPAHTSLGVDPDRRASEEQLDRLAARLQNERAVGIPAPGIIALHAPYGERVLLGLAPLIISGHTHSGRMYVSDGTVRLNSGTLGGMPYDPETTQRATLPHSASILYYTQRLPRRLVAIDRISVASDRSTTLTRHIVDETLLAGAESP